YKSEPNSPNHALSYPHIICVTKAFTETGKRTRLFESVNDLYGWYNSVCAGIGNNPESLKSKVTELTANKKTDQEKVESIFYWVQDNIRYIAFENGIMGFKPDAAQNVFKNKYGDCKGKANLLKTMLTLAGFDARLTWIGTSDLPYDYSLPSLSVDNHMICTVILNGKRYFLDGTEEHIALNDYAQRIQGKQVLIEDGNNHLIDRIPEFPAERNKVVITKKLSIADTQLAGNATAQYNGESKISVQGAYSSIRNEKKSESLTNFLSHRNRNVEVLNIANPDFADRQKPLQLKYDLKANNQVTKTGSELYVVVDWDKEFGDMEMPADRKNDYEFDQKYYLTSQTELTVPEGYKVDYIPAAFKKSTPSWSFEGAYANKGKSIVYTKTIIINKPILKKTDFAAWNSFIADINKFYNDQVVLVK
ncbi:MAG TPA: transglutaminase domain-containing protein, partial [Ferruginibacter sp.]|nr:transglutaminase domain-containing protein [Ferruginibacter sp.]